VHAKLSLVLLSLVFAGCVLSLQPLYTQSEVGFDPALVGTWKPADASVTWKCTRARDGGYRVVYTDEKGRRGEFAARLVTVQGKRFLDLFPLPPPASLSPFYTDHWIAGHTVAGVLEIGKTLELAVLDEEWLKKLLAQHPQAIHHEIVGGDVVLTASTQDLQRFLLAHLETAGAFRRALSLRRAS
jgi:hypothetical protein